MLVCVPMSFQCGVNRIGARCSWQVCILSSCPLGVLKRKLTVAAAGTVLGAGLAPSNRPNACAGSTQLLRRKWASSRAHNLAVCPWNTWPVCVPAKELTRSLHFFFAPVEALLASDGLKRRSEGSWQTKAGEVARRVCRQWCEWTA